MPNSLLYIYRHTEPPLHCTKLYYYNEHFTRAPLLSVRMFVLHHLKSWVRTTLHFVVVTEGVSTRNLPTDCVFDLSTNSDIILHCRRLEAGAIVYKAPRVWIRVIHALPPLPPLLPFYRFSPRHLTCSDGCMDTLAFSSTATRFETVAPGGEARGCARPIIHHT